MVARLVDKGFVEQLTGYGLTTAEILYHLPDHPSLLQTFIWQEYDLHPRFPRLIGFLDFWTRNIDAKLGCIRVAHQGLVQAAELRLIAGELRVH